MPAVRYTVFLSLPATTPEQQARVRAFSTRFAAHASQWPGEFVFPEDAWPAARVVLDDDGLAGERHVQLRPTPGRWDEFAGYFLGHAFVPHLVVDGVVDARRVARAGLVKDGASGAHFATPRVRRLLDGVCRGLAWEAAGEKVWRLVTTVAAHAPLAVVRPIEVRENHRPPGTWTVRGDGRMTMAPGDVELLHAHGALAVDATRVGPRHYPVASRLIASPLVMAALAAAKCRACVDEPFPLLAEDSPLVRLEP